jgi:beta-glucuronidase
MRSGYIFRRPVRRPAISLLSLSIHLLFSIHLSAQDHSGVARKLPAGDSTGIAVSDLSDNSRLTLVGFVQVDGGSGGAQKGVCNLVANIDSRRSMSLNGKWQYLVDPYETGFYDYRFKERRQSDPEAYWSSDQPLNKTDRKEHGYIDKYTLRVPGDWNSQDNKFLYYEGTIWYKKSFDYTKTKPSDKVFLYFGAVNYQADVYLNGIKLGMHKGGFTPFNFAIPDSLLKKTDNYLVVKVDNKRHADEIPTLNTDWWNYGGITRDVKLLELPDVSAIMDYSLQLKPGDRQPMKPGDKLAGKSGQTHSPIPGDPEQRNPAHLLTHEVTGWVQLSNASVGEEIIIDIPELSLRETFAVRAGLARIDFNLPAYQPWSPEHPKCYRIIISSRNDRVEEKIGFRTVEVQGKKLLLNGKPVFLRGISIHEEIAKEQRRAYSRTDALHLLGMARELGCNMVRLAHYPHNEHMARVADSLGLLIWSEIPVYWTIDFSNPEVLEKAKNQLQEMISRDRNRASVIIWSVGNETPVSEARTGFMKTLLETAREQDPTRLVSAALEVNYYSAENQRSVDDPLGQYVDLVAFNEYLGWYGGTPASCRLANWGTKYDKPMFISETGAEAVGGYHADSLTLWSEEFQQWYYREQIAMLRRMPDNFIGISPWVLTDFRSPRRNNPVYQDGWNKKGLIDQNGQKKKAFYVLQKFYSDIKIQGGVIKK